MITNYGSSFGGIVCKGCKREETELEKLGISVNISLEMCYQCLKKKDDSKKDEERLSKDSVKFVKSLVSKYGAEIEEIKAGRSPENVGMSHTDMTCAFVEVLYGAYRVVKGKTL